MVALALIKASNTSALPSSIPHGLVALFIGATTGIGRAALEQLVVAASGKSPRIYVVGRNPDAAAPLLAHLRSTDQSATIHFIHKDVSLVRDADAAAQFVKSREEKLDLLFTSSGFISFEGRKETVEGLEPSMTTRFYSRARAIQQLLPLLEKSENPHVTNIAAGGLEDKMDLDDLDLAAPGNYSIAKAAVHSTTMFTLTLERFAEQHPRISFVHAFPGLVSTPTLSRGSSGVSGFLLRNIVGPLVRTVLAATPEDAGARALFYATNARYTVDATAGHATPLPEGMEKATMTKKGVFLVNEKSDSAQNEKVLDPIRESSAEKVAAHLDQIFARVL
jgi:NAD(P)-dependent dehydrogenase (short-subunit alcohol dehydrogenase family)